jgi:hypothetical protein
LAARQEGKIFERLNITKMKITLSNNINNVGVGIEANRDEIGGIKAMRELADKFQGEMTRAYEAAQMLWKEYPEFKQVTLDTMTDEERDMLEQAENSNNKN